jgi:tetratricopeptide (TPR) repeat protein
VSARIRTYFFVALAAVSAAALVVGTVAFTRTSTGGGGSAHTETQASKRPSGAPRLLLDLGVRTDPEARALRLAASLYDGNRRGTAGRIFRRYQSVQAQVGAAFSAWPDSAAAKLERLGRRRPRDAFVQLHLGLARYWQGRTAAARAAWRAASARDPDTASAVHADDLLHPQFVPGRPEFVVAKDYPRGLERLPPPRQFDALAAAARGGGVRARLFYGAALQRLGRPVSAERQFASAAHAAPGDPEALAAAAVGRFTKADPAAAFSRLGPLARRFPRAQTVRFHLGLMLLYLKEVDQARKELRLARELGPQSLLGRSANAFLVRLSRLGPNNGN